MDIFLVIYIAIAIFTFGMCLGRVSDNFPQTPIGDIFMCILGGLAWPLTFIISLG